VNYRDNQFDPLGGKEVQSLPAGLTRSGLYRIRKNISIPDEFDTLSHDVIAEFYIE
jgi:hypothetical protein